MDRVLVGIDGSAASMDAGRWAADLTQRGGLDLVAARVFEPAQAELPPDQSAAHHHRQQEELDEWCASLRGQEPRRLLLEGDPPDALLAAAHDHQADLLVVGGRGQGGFLNLHLGSVAHHLAHHTTVPLAIVPTTGAMPVRHLVLGVDGSSGSHVAAEVGADLAACLGVGVTAVHAFEPLAIWVPANDADSWRRQAEADAETWARPVGEAGVDLKVDVDRDIHPAAAIARALDAQPGSAAVVGTRGLGGFTGMRLGRVPLQVVHHTGAAVVLVPPDEDT